MADKTVTTRGGNIGSVLVNAVLLWGINIWPGWKVVPFLTADIERVLGMINASLTAGIIANLIFVVIRNRGVMALGNLAVLGIGLAATLRMLEVFPFDFGDSWSGWPVVVRVLLVLGIVGSIIGMVVEIVAMFRSLAGFGERARQ
ncbi:hypothetical protein [Pseudarthrobacter oxydans]|uniref:hypothetical protein n=1 Tax=Pseudarthrobacter oxydans TaxID=1671 RepID=UPI002AA70BE7|nr:hypothetical protein [Pseudarthrobacter oxydans]WPU08524.1 hypothetical protein SMD14_15400 [Pseudarthrobacter oxydans]